jgi:hypothetical protein
MDHKHLQSTFDIQHVLLIYYLFIFFFVPAFFIAELTEDMYKDGYEHITNIDISDVLIKVNKARTEKK